VVLKVQELLGGGLYLS